MVWQCGICGSSHLTMDSADSCKHQDDNRIWPGDVFEATASMQATDEPEPDSRGVAAYDFIYTGDVIRAGVVHVQKQKSIRVQIHSVEDDSVLGWVRCDELLKYAEMIARQDTPFRSMKGAVKHG